MIITFALDLRAKNVNNNVLMVNNTVEKFEANFKKSKSFSKNVIEGIKFKNYNLIYFGAINGGMPLQLGGQSCVKS
jgi:hypothetical protein